MDSRGFPLVSMGFPWGGKNLEDSVWNCVKCKSTARSRPRLCSRSSKAAGFWGQQCWLTQQNSFSKQSRKRSRHSSSYITVFFAGAASHLTHSAVPASGESKALRIQRCWRIIIKSMGKRISAQLCFLAYRLFSTFRMCSDNGMHLCSSDIDVVWKLDADMLHHAECSYQRLSGQDRMRVDHIIRITSPLLKLFSAQSSPVSIQTQSLALASSQ